MHDPTDANLQRQLGLFTYKHQKVKLSPLHQCRRSVLPIFIWNVQYSIWKQNLSTESNWLIFVTLFAFFSLLQPFHGNNAILLKILMTVCVQWTLNRCSNSIICPGRFGEGIVLRKKRREPFVFPKNIIILGWKIVSHSEDSPKTGPRLCCICSWGKQCYF